MSTMNSLYLLLLVVMSIVVGTGTGTRHAASASDGVSSHKSGQRVRCGSNVRVMPRINPGFYIYLCTSPFAHDMIITDEFEAILKRYYLTTS